jgi:uncharacterized repeat protein (TIGR02543 family)
MRFNKSIIAFAIFFVLLSVSGCQKDITIQDVTIEGPGIEEAIIIDFFDIDDLTLTVVMSDGTTEVIPLTLDMISAADLLKLSSIGNHQITINYLGFSKTTTIKLIYDDLTSKLREIYALAYESNAIGEMTYEEWLESIRGEDGTDGREVELRISSDGGLGYIQWRYVGESLWTNLISLSSLMGESGTDGKNIEIQSTDDYLQWRYVGDLDWINLIDLSLLVGPQGEIGVSIESITINELGELIILFTDGTIDNIGIIMPIEITYQLIFRYDRRGAIYEYMTVLPNQVIEEPLYPVRSGYMFEGWFLNDVQIEFPYIFTHDMNITFIAKWTEVPFEYNISEEEVTITGYNAFTQNVVIIPKEIEGYPVTEIAEEAFLTYPGIQTIYIPNTIKHIGFRAFYMCSSLSKVTFEDESQLESIGAYAFSSNPNLFSIDFGDNSQLKTIGEYAFKSSGYIEYIEIPDTVIEIGAYAFSQNGWLKHVDISEDSQLKTIGTYAFSNLSELNHFFIPKTVTEIESGAFSSSNKVTIYSNHASQPSTWASDWNVSGLNTLWNVKYEGKTEDLRYIVSSTNQVIIIDNVAPSFSRLTVPESIDDMPVTMIGDYAFNEVAITYLSLPNSLQTIGKYAFSNNLALSNVFFGIDSQLTTIKERAFYSTSIYHVFIPLNVSTLGAYVFSNISNLLIYTEHLTKPSGWESTWNNDARPVTWGIKDYNIMNHVYYMIKQDDSLIITGSEMGVRSIIIPDIINGVAVTTIETNAFTYMGLMSVIIPSSVTHIKDYAFTGNPYLTIYTKHQVIPAGWTTNWNISNRPLVLNILSYGITSGLHFIKKDLTNVHIVGIEPNVVDIDIPSVIDETPVTAINDYSLAFHESLVSVHIPNSIKKIGVGALAYDKKLISVTFESSSQLTKIEPYTFYMTSSLQQIVIPANIERIEAHAFSNSISLSSVTFEENSQLTYIGHSAFYGSAMTVISIPNTVITIDQGAFSYNQSLTAVSFGLNSQLETIGNSAFSHTALQSITIPKSVLQIGWYAFMSNPELISVEFELGTSLSSIETYAFAYNMKLNEIIIPASVITMGGHVFSGSKNITIYVRAYSRPSGWNETWNYYEYPVIWGYTG